MCFLHNIVVLCYLQYIIAHVIIKLFPQYSWFLWVYLDLHRLVYTGQLAILEAINQFYDSQNEQLQYQKT